MKEMEMCFYIGGMTSKSNLYVVNETDDRIYLCEDEDLNDTVWEFDKATGECLNDNTFLGARRYLEV